MKSKINPWDCVHRWVCYSLSGEHQYDYCEICGFKVAPKFEVAPKPQADGGGDG